MHNALGFRSFKSQLRHFDKVVFQKEQIITSDVQKMMDYGKEHEEDGVATLTYPPFFLTCVMSKRGAIS